MNNLRLFTSGFDSLMESLVHQKLRQEPDTHSRAKVLVGMLLLIDVVALISCSVLIVGPMTSKVTVVGIAICFSLIVGNFLLLYILRNHGHFVFCSLTAAGLAAVGVVLSILISGGIVLSPVTRSLIMPPLLVFFFNGKRLGGYSLLLTLAAILLLYLAERTKVFVPFRMDTADIELSRELTTYFAVVWVSVMGFIFERNASKLKRERDAEHEKTLVMSQTDALTGLSNRRSFDAQLTLRIGMQPPPHFALCYIDLDGFKPINDRFGHAAGDEVLRTVACRLRQFARDHDVIGRQGGDEFTLIFDAWDSPVATKQAMERLLALIADPIETSVGIVSVGCSAGIALFPQHGGTAEGLKRAADQAMYAAKQQRNQWRMYEREPLGESNTR